MAQSRKLFYFVLLYFIFALLYDVISRSEYVMVNKMRENA
jgi:hypothetical protein